MPNPTPNNLLLRALLLSIEQERKSHTAKLMWFEEQVRALLGESGENREWLELELPSGHPLKPKQYEGL
jgi:hypothetical protein